MTAQEKRIKQAEALVKRILVQNFKQRLSADVIREVAEKVAAAVPPAQSKRFA